MLKLVLILAVAATLVWLSFNEMITTQKKEPCSGWILFYLAATAVYTFLTAIIAAIIVVAAIRG